MDEIWKDIKGYEEIYQISNLGRVKSLPRIALNGRKLYGKILSIFELHNGYKAVSLYNKKGVYKKRKISDLVMEAFNEDYERYKNKKYWIHNVDGDKSNNEFINLKFCHPVQIAYLNELLGRTNHEKGSKKHFSKLLEEDVKWIRVYLYCGYKDTEIAKVFNVTPGNIWFIKSNIKWKHVNADCIINFLKGD